MMAPESERAKMERCAKKGCGQYEGASCHDFENGWGKGAHEFQPAEPALPCPPNESNRTQFESGCSEVVERLAKCLFLADNDGVVSATLDRSKATAILHSWRERRVQELEELLAKRSLSPEPQSTQRDTTKENHCYELVIPESLPEELRARLDAWQSKCLHWGHGYEPPKATKADREWALLEARELLRLIDEAHGIPTIEASWK